MMEFDAALRRGLAAVARNARIAFCTALLFGLAAHLYMFTGKYVNHDEILNLFAHGDLITSGRWFLRFFASLNSNFSMPWVNGLISLVFLSASAGMIVTLLEIRSPLFAALFSAVFVVFPSVGNTFAFMFTADAYAMVLALTVFCALITDRSKWGFLVSIPLLTLCLASYQPYFCFFIGLMGLTGLRRLLDGSMNDRETWIKIAKYSCAVIGGLVAYLLATKAVLALAGAELSGYLGVDAMGQIRLGELPKQIFQAYYQFFYFLFYTSYKYSGLWLSIVHLALLAASAGMLVRLLHRPPRGMSRLQKGLALLVFLLLPLLLNCAWLMGVPSVHIMMMYQVCLLYALSAMLYQLFPSPKPGERKKTAAVLLSWGLALCLGISALSWTVYTNQGYLELQLKYENMYAMANRVTDRIEQTPGYEPGITPVAVLGYYRTGNYDYSKGPWFGKLDYAVGFGGPSEYDFLADDLHFHYFARYYLGVDFVFAQEETLSSIKSSAAYAAMPCYPQEGCIAMIDGVLVVRVGGEIGDR